MAEVAEAIPWLYSDVVGNVTGITFLLTVVILSPDRAVNERIAMGKIPLVRHDYVSSCAYTCS